MCRRREGSGGGSDMSFDTWESVLPRSRVHQTIAMSRGWYVLSTIDSERVGWPPIRNISECDVVAMFRTRERKEPSQGIIQGGPRSDRNPKAPTHEDLYQCGLNIVKKNYGWQRGTCTNRFTKSARRTMKIRIRSSKQSFDTGVISRTGVIHEERGASTHMMSKSDLAPEEQDTIRKASESSTVITANGSITTTKSHCLRQECGHVD